MVLIKQNDEVWRGEIGPSPSLHSPPQWNDKRTALILICGDGGTCNSGSAGRTAPTLPSLPLHSPPHFPPLSPSFPPSPLHSPLLLFFLVLVPSQWNCENVRNFRFGDNVIIWKFSQWKLLGLSTYRNVNKDIVKSSLKPQALRSWRSTWTNFEPDSDVMAIGLSL